MEDDNSVEAYDPAVVKFGTDELMAEYRDPAPAQQLVDARHGVTLNLIVAACYNGNEPTLETLLSAKPNPDVRLAESPPLIARTLEWMLGGQHPACLQILALTSGNGILFNMQRLTP
jgi:hypothetical protein